MQTVVTIVPITELPRPFVRIASICNPFMKRVSTVNRAGRFVEIGNAIN